jgi:3-phosphoshikimate 1-carboxyvinyltransferase
VGAGALSIEPLERPPDTSVTLPGSKSITNRALLCAALAGGRSRIEGALVADDTEAMIGAVGVIGADCRIDEITGTISVDGVAGDLTGGGDSPIDARMSGTTARFLTPVLAAGSWSREVDGHSQLRNRPMGDLVGALRSLGVEVAEKIEADHLPLRVTGPFRSDRVELVGMVSSQFVSGLLMAGPLTASGLTVSVTTDLVSRPYVDMTVAVMEAFGASVEVVDDFTWRVEHGGYRAVDGYQVEPDASAASYFLAAAAMTGGRVRIEGLSRTSLQGDITFAEVLALLGARTSWTDDSVEVRGNGLVGADVDLGNLSDTAPTLAVVAALAESPTRVSGIGFIRAKESDRIAGPVSELRRCGVDAEETADGFVVRPGGPPHGARIRTYEDHRMAMAFALLGLVVPGIEIEDPGVVAKTFPDYFASLDQLR